MICSKKKSNSIKKFSLKSRNTNRSMKKRRNYSTKKNLGRTRKPNKKPLSTGPNNMPENKMTNLELDHLKLGPKNKLENDSKKLKKTTNGV